LLLNYINSALAFPRVRESSAGLLFITAALAAALSLVGLVLGWALAWITRVKPGTRAALMFGLSMKHTGLALVLAGKALADQPLAILIIVLATLMQHLLAGVAQWWIERLPAA
jgi:predicted Na+-dependent transporter